MDNRTPSNRLRFESETEDATSGQLVPKSAPDSQATPNSRLRFEEDMPTESALKQDSQSSRLRFEDEDTPENGGDPTPPNNTNPKAKNKAVQAEQTAAQTPKATPTPQDNKQVQNAKKKADKIDGKLDKAREVLAGQKPYKPPSLIKQFGHFMAWRYAHRKIHQKIHQVEHENVGTESAHKTELAAEGVVRVTSRIVKRRIRTRPARRVRKLSRKNAKAQANHAYQKLLQDNPDLRKKTLARFYHKQRLKMTYAKQARQAAQGVKRSGGIITKATTAIKNIAVALVKKNPKLWLIIALFGMLLMLLQSCMAMFTAIGGGMGGVIGATTHIAESVDIDDATILYTRLEAELEYRIINAESDHPDFDEYRFSIGGISHNPLELIAFLTAVYNDFTFSEVQATINEIFNEQYQLEFTPEMEIRTRTETRTGTGSWTDSEGESHSYTYTYTVIVEYEWHILYVTLTSQSFRDVILSRMDEEQTDRFNLLMLTNGNRQYLHSPFSFNWLPFVSSFYGYRIHPINGGKSFHWGLDIGLSEGTEILSGQDGMVIFAAYSGGYGFLVVICNGEGLVSRYAHCSVLYVSVGDVVVAGDVIARVGSTGASTGPHLHLEIIKNGRHLNPLLFTVTNHHL